MSENVLLLRVHVHLASLLNQVSCKDHGCLRYPRIKDRTGLPKSGYLVGASMPPKVKATEQPTKTRMPMCWEVKAKDDQGG